MANIIYSIIICIYLIVIGIRIYKAMAEDEKMIEVYRKKGIAIDRKKRKRFIDYFYEANGFYFNE